MRPSYLPKICKILSYQTYAQTELVVVLHGHKATNLSPDERLALENARVVLEISSDRSYSYCFNAAIAAARGTFVAKIDDDDLYGREYLAEAVRHLLVGDGDVVGKAEFYIYLGGSGTVVLRTPGLSCQAVEYVAPGTLVFPRSLALQCPFREPTSRAGAVFVEDCLLRNKTIYATSRRNFMYIRRAKEDSHTWAKPDDALIKGGIVLRQDWHRTTAELLELIERRAA